MKKSGNKGLTTGNNVDNAQESKNVNMVKSSQKSARVSKASAKIRTRSTIIFIVFVALLAMIGYVAIFGGTFGDYNFKTLGSSINKGLDLQGGVSLLEEIQSDKVSDDTVERTVELLRLRVDKLGVTEPVVNREGSKRIRIEIPGVYDAESVIKTVGKTGELKFVGPDKSIILTGKDVKQATGVPSSQDNQPEIDLTFTSDGAKKFSDATAKYLNQAISIYMDTDLVQSATVQAHITDGKARITNMKSMDEARRIAKIIQSGALPVSVKAVETKVVGATLGANSLPQSKKAGMIGIALVFIFMLLYYRVPGLLADIALTLYILLVLGIFSLMKVTLTLPGIAGFLLTIGMAVDANVLIFERIKEELRIGKSVRSAVGAGFHRAMSSILDSNITTIISGIVLYALGRGSVKGFALTLIIGIAVSMFTAITITRLLVKLAVNMGMLDKLWCFRVKREAE